MGKSFESASVSSNSKTKQKSIKFTSRGTKSKIVLHMRALFNIE